MLVLAAKKYDLKQVYFLLRCAQDKHDHCTSVCDATVNHSKNILRAHTTDLEMGGERYCVTGEALVKNSEVGAFKKNLWKIQTNTKDPIGVKALKVFVSK